MRDPLENHELTFSGTLPLDGRPEELLLEELTDLMDDAALRIRRIRKSDAVAQLHRRRDDGLRRRRRAAP
jgi:hypothetical protein